MSARRVLAAAAATALAATLGVGATASAAPGATPGGPWVQDSQNVSLSSLHSYDELTESLQKIQHTSGGRLDLSSIGTTNEGRDIWFAQVGTGDRKVLFVTQQHGNEPLPTEAALQVLQRLAGTNASWVRDILDEITLGVVVRANPDGTERYQRQNVDPDCAGAFCATGRGFDMNRYHDPAMAVADNPVPESAALQQLVRSWQPDITVDYHHQGSYVSEDGRLITSSVLWPTNPDVDPAVVDGSKRLAVMFDETVSHYGHGEVSLYPGGDIAGIARNSFGLQGSDSLLVEFRGGIGQKSSGYLIKQAYLSMMAFAAGAADGSLDALDPSLADEIPDQGPRVTGE